MLEIKPLLPDKAVVFSGSSNRPLAEKIVAHLRVKLGPLTSKIFSDGEHWVQYQESIRGKDVFIIQSTISDFTIMELLLLIDAAKLAKAEKIIAVIPYFGYARQDRKDQPRVSMSSALICRLIETAGATAVILAELHNAAILAAFTKTLHDHLYLTENMWSSFSSIPNLAVMSTDAGSSKMARYYAEKLKTERIAGDKIRTGHNRVGEIKIIGSVKEKNVLIVDDIGDTLGTMSQGTETCIKDNCLNIYASLVHPVFSGHALEVINKIEKLKKVVVTNTIHLPPEKLCDKIEVVDVSRIFATAISRFHYEESIDSLFQQ